MQKILLLPIRLTRYYLRPGSHKGKLHIIPNFVEEMFSYLIDQGFLRSG